MNILALDCSGPVLSLALEAGEGRFVLHIDQGFQHTRFLIPAADELLSLAKISPKDLDLVLCSGGPGSFTALRIGMAAAKGMARGADCPFKGVPSLEVLAWGREHWPGVVLPLMDARKSRVYAAAFRGGKKILGETDISLKDLWAALPPGEPVLATGPDAAALLSKEKPERVILDPLAPDGRGGALLTLGRELFLRLGGDPPESGPVYLRKSEAETALNQQKPPQNSPL